MFEWLRHKRAAAPDRLSNRHVLMRPARVVRGRYDAAQTTSDNERHWANADFLAADAANSPEVRRALRCRARYEVANNSYARRPTASPSASRRLRRRGRRPGSASTRMPTPTPATWSLTAAR